MLRRRGTAFLAALAPVVLLGIVGAPAASAALGGLTAFAIDGDTTGPDDWDDPPSAVLDLSVVDDACGNGVLDPDQLDGKLDDLDLDAPEVTPGNVVSKGDLCRVWTATQAVPDGAAGFHVILYGAWQRFSSNGEASMYWPLLGPAPGKADDVLVKFDDGSVTILQWDGDTWVTTSTPGPGVVDAAVDVPGDATFGEFALDVTALGLPGLADCPGYTSGEVLSQTGNDANAELQDYVGTGPVEVGACGSLLLTKVTVPADPGPSVTFGYEVSRDGGLDVRPGDVSVVGDLTVPDAPEVEVDGLLGGSDYTLSEPSLSAGWTNASMVCQVVDPATGVPATVDVSAGATFSLVPAQRTTCTLTNVAPPTLTIVKQAEPEDGTTFTFDATRAPADVLPSFTLTSGQSTTIPVAADDEVTVTEQATAGWSTEVSCVGDDEAVTGGASATVQVDPGEQIVCLFVNSGAVDPTRAALVVAKAAPRAAGATFDVTVAGPGADPGTVTLAPDDVDVQAVVTTPDAGGSTYTVTEASRSGWQLGALVCVGPGATTTDLATATATVVLEPGQVAACLYRNDRVAPAPIPPASLTVTKHTDPGGGPSFAFLGSGLSPRAFALTDGESQAFTGLSPGTYRVAEIPVPGWVAEGSCSNGDTVAGGRVEVTLRPGEQVTCDITNTKQASLTLTKVADPQTDQDFAFVVRHADAAPGTVLLDDDGDPTDDPENEHLPASLTAPAAPPGVWTVTETAVPGWSVSDLTCTGGTVLVVDPASRTATVSVAPGESASCVVTNTAVAGGPTTGPATGPTTGGSTGGVLASSGFAGWPLGLLSVLLISVGAVLKVVWGPRSVR
ncbi:hypothetical protein OEB99_05075 [Actinotalea sp. M2MS4P-6]|nr:hypothetical protein [Actinotalea sp. M2MS4P-6]